MASRDQIADLLGSGLSNTEVAMAVGCDPSYITQLLSDEVFANEIAIKRTTTLAAANKRDESIDALEDKLLVRLHDAVDNDRIYKPMEIARTLRSVNEMKRRGHHNKDGSTTINNIVNLTLPAAIKRSYTLNNQSEVVETDGQTLVTMPTSTLLRELASKKSSGNDGEVYNQLQRHIPGSKAGGA